MDRPRHVTTNLEVAHQSWMVRCFPHPSRFSQSIEILDLFSQKSQYVTEISSCHHENRPIILKILTVHNKILTSCHKILNLSSRKARLFIVKHRAVIIKISTVHNKVSIFQNTSRLLIIKSRVFSQMAFRRERF